MSTWLWNISTTSLDNLSQCLDTLRVEKCFLMFRENFLCFSLYPLSLICHRSPLRRALLHSLCTFPSVLIHAMRLTLSLFFSRPNSPISLTFLAGEVLQSLQHLSDPSLDSYLGRGSPKLVTGNPILMLSLLEHLGPKLRVIQTTSPLELLNPGAGELPERIPGGQVSPVAMGRWGWRAFCDAHADGCVGQDGPGRMLCLSSTADVKAGSWAIHDCLALDSPMQCWNCCCHPFWARGHAMVLSLGSSGIYSFFFPHVFQPLKVSTAVWSSMQPHFSILPPLLPSLLRCLCTSIFPEKQLPPPSLCPSFPSLSPGDFRFFFSGWQRCYV